MFLEISTTKVLATYLAVDLARAGQGPHNEGMTRRESSLIFVAVWHLTAAAEFDEDSPLSSLRKEGPKLALNFTPCVALSDSRLCAILPPPNQATFVYTAPNESTLCHVA